MSRWRESCRSRSLDGEMGVVFSMERWESFSRRENNVFSMEKYRFLDGKISFPGGICSDRLGECESKVRLDEI